MNLTAVCINKKPINGSPFPQFVQYTSLVEAPPRGTLERTKMLAGLRNEAMRIALQNFPKTTHVLMADSYYLNQLDTIDRLIVDYKE